MLNHSPPSADPPAWPGETHVESTDAINRHRGCGAQIGECLDGAGYAFLPARVDNAYSNGLVARSIAGPSCCAIVLATSLPNTSLATMPRKRSAVRISLGMFACARRRPAENNRSASRLLLRTGFKCSVVTPEGPAAAPRRARMRLFRKSALSSVDLEGRVR